MALSFEVFNSASVAGATSKTINLSTLGTDRIALLFVYMCSQDASARPTVTSVSDGSGLTWTLFKAYNFDSSDPTNVLQRVEVYWAYTAAQQTADVVTVVVSTNARGIGLGVGAIAGVPASRFSAPFDADPSDPQTASNPSLTLADCTATISTHDSENVVLGIGASAITSGNTFVTPSGYTDLISLGFNGTGSVNLKLEIVGKVYTAQQTNLVVSLGTNRNWGYILTAVGGTRIFPHSQAPSAGF